MKDCCFYIRLFSFTEVFCVRYLWSIKGAQPGLQANTSPDLQSGNLFETQIHHEARYMLISFETDSSKIYQRLFLTGFLSFVPSVSQAPKKVNFTSNVLI